LGSAAGSARRAVTSAAASLDRSVIRWAEERMQRTAEAQAAARRRRGDPAPQGLLRDKALEIAAAYAEDTRELPSRFFPAPERAELTLTAVLAAGEGPQGSRVTDLTFPSTYQPFWSGIRDSYLNYRENQRGHARWWRLPARAEAAPRPTLILIHGWRAGAHWMSERVFEVPYWLRHGFDVVAFQLPFHGGRTPEGGASGALFLTRNLARTNEAFGHAIYDLRALAAALRQQHGVGSLGALGMSLGGYTTALWSTVSDELDFAVAMIPAVAMHQLMLRGDGQAAQARKDGIDEALLQDAFAVHSPLARPPLLPAERLFVIAGDGDQITPAAQAQALIAHWRCPSHWFAGGHLAQVGRRPAMRAARLHLRDGGIDGG
jgi:dienelactone hydrolase